VQRPIDIQVHIPGLAGKQVRDLAQYIQVVYAWGVRVAAIAAVIAIMIGGLLWLTSAGAERLGKAKEIIGNAIIGLLLALFSFVILKTINPDLVRLSLPRTMMVRTIAVGAQFCFNVPSDVPILEGGPNGAIVADSARASLRCGFTYHTPSALAKTCVGYTCDSGKMCLSEGTGTYECVEGVIGGSLGGDSEVIRDPDHGVELHVVCSDGSDHRILSTHWIPTAQRQRFFTFPKSPSAIRAVESACGGSTGEGTVSASTVRGFTFWMIVNGDWRAVGMKSCGGASKPLSVTASDEGNVGNIVWRSLGDDEFINQMRIYAALRQPRPGFPVTPFQCDLTLNRSNFP